MALSSVSGASSEVITITLGRFFALRSFFKTSKPFIFGIHISSSTKSNLPAFIFFSAAAPSSTHTIVYFWARSVSESNKRVVRSSSATRMRVIFSSAGNAGSGLSVLLLLFLAQQLGAPAENHSPVLPGSGILLSRRPFLPEYPVFHSHGWSQRLQS